MKIRKILEKLTASILTLSMVASLAFIGEDSVFAKENNKSTSQIYVEAMGKGWNLGNSFDGFDADLDKEDQGEEAWGNPVVTRELISEIKEKGYDSIRIPFTAYRRYSEVDGKYVIDQVWLDRYKEVVNWALEEGLYVMVNLHHDSWIWLAEWDGNKESEEYKIFIDLWEQLADTFKDFPEEVCFETINEPRFNEGDEEFKQDKLDIINLAAYEVIRNSGGKNDARMIVMPTMDTNHSPEKSNPLKELITSLMDENIIATVHYYSEWVFSANLGKTGFDEPLFDWSNDYTARKAAEEMFDIVSRTFTQDGIGVVIGEWGLLGYDAGNECNQLGEELKYYDYISHLADENDISIMFWDNGSGIDRLDTKEYSWRKPLVGNALEAGIRGERSSYSTGLNTIYLQELVNEDLEIELTLNGNEFEGIKGLTEGIDYTFNKDNSTVTLLKSFINNKFNSLAEDEYGDIADLVMKFSEGADWHQYLVKYTEPVLSNTNGTTDGLSIPTKFNGTKLRRATAYDKDGNIIGPNSSWWSYLQYTSAFIADYENGTIEIYNNFFNDYTVTDGEIKFAFEFYDGQVVDYILVKDGANITGTGNEKNNEDDDTENPGEDNEDEETPGENEDNQNPGADGSYDKNEGGNGSINSNPENTNQSINSGKDKLPKTGAVTSTTIICGIALILIAIGGVVFFKRRECNK
ncbi:cellulase family glycosylhydrolase [Clostridium sp. D53t1_180928_C8]|uniref:cellulase family glycosylhydrolase n=1 Tax=Clostridium sp. D53t1_180928_C8 TaxID=2787101 RepID=UPI0018AC5EBC